MLVLSRKINEKIVIGQHVTITIVESSDNRVCLGIDAPQDIPVYRQEVFDKIQREKELEDAA